ISRLDWQPLREKVKQVGMRNSNVMAIAPTATIANIAGCYPSIEPMYKNLYVKSNISGEFTIINRYLVDDLKKINLWHEEMLEQIKYFDGELENIKEIPQALKDKYKGAFEIDPIHMLKMTALRGKWIDQSQSHNVFMKGVSGKKLEDIYMAAWQLGMKTAYYLRTLGATQIEKSTLDAKKYGFTQKRDFEQTKSQEVEELPATEPRYAAGVSCNPFGGECESCQ
ncbi:MAG: ribonucleoside-diphosphate reductase subunit alpha, partial [Candidatus Babeliales bacterium]